MQGQLRADASQGRGVLAAGEHPSPGVGGPLEDAASRSADLLMSAARGMIFSMFEDFPSAALIATNRYAEEAGLTSSALDKALRAHRIFAVELAGERYVPGFYLDERYEKRQLESVCRALGDLPGGSKLQFFVTSKGSLGGRTPLEALAQGKLSAVRRTAQGFAEG